MQREKKSRARARLSEAGIMHSIAELHAEMTRGQSAQVDFVGEFRPLSRSHERKDKLFVAVFNGDSYAVQVVAKSVAAPVNVLARLASYVTQSPETFLERAMAPSVSGLTEAERSALTEGGVHLDRPANSSVAMRTRLEFATLMEESLSVDAVARMLDVNSSRIRQRLGGDPRSLFGVKVGKAWRIPRFQFDGKRLVPGIDTVMEKMPRDLSPVAVYRWFTSRSAELELDDEAVSPLDWLKGGGDAATVGELAAEL